MKITKTLFINLIAASLLVVNTSCTNDDDTVSTTELTEEEAVELIGASLQKSTGGMNDSAETFSSELTADITINEVCDTMYDETFVISYDETYAQASYSVDWSYQMECNNLSIPQNVEFAFSTDGNYSTQRIVSNDNSSGSFIITGLQPSASEMVMNGNYIRSGMQELTVINTRSVQSNLEIELTNIAINKSTSSISSGSGTVILTGTSQNISFSFTGSIVFNGNGSATLTINGNQHEINLG